MVGAFSLHVIEPLPVPFGIEIDGEKNDIAYLDSALDKWSMSGDRQRFFKDVNTAVNKAKHEQASKAN